MPSFQRPQRLNLSTQRFSISKPLLPDFHRRMLYLPVKMQPWQQIEQNIRKFYQEALVTEVVSSEVL